MLGDFFSTAAAFALFPLFFVIPGFVAGELSGAADFRSSPFPVKFLLAVLLSISITPVFTYLLSRTGSPFPLWGGYGVIWLIFLGLVQRNNISQSIAELLGWLSKKWVLAAILVWGVLAYVMTAGIEWDGGLSLSLTVHDHLKHVAVTDAITRTGVPPINPSFFPGESLPLYYYYFWFLMCSLVDQLGGDVVGPLAAVTAGTLWTGLGLMAAFLIVQRFFVHSQSRSLIPPRYALALFLLMVTGLDLLPVAGLGILRATTGLGPGILSDFQWWNEQVSSWPGAMIWVPHHVAAFIASMTGFLILRRLCERPFDLRHVPAAIIGSLAFSSSAGLSAWVTLVAALAYVLWMVVSVMAKWREELPPHLLVGFFSFFFAVPYLLDISAAGLLTGFPVETGVREFFPVTKAGEWFGLDVPCGPWCRLLLLPVNYGLELGFFFLAAIFYWRWRAKERGLSKSEVFFALLTATSFLVCSFFRAALYNNDLAWRGLLFAQFMLLLWTIPVAAEILSRPRAPMMPPLGPHISRGWRTILVLALALGVAGTAAEMLRTRLQGADARSLFYKEAYHWADRHLPRDAVLQHNPERKVDVFHALYGNRQVAVSDHLYGGLYGIPAGLFREVHAPVAGIFAGTMSLENVVEICTRLKIGYLVVKSTDPVWVNSSGPGQGSWMEGVKAVFSNDHARIYSLEELRAALHSTSAAP